jgi:hypothetical protein
MRNLNMSIISGKKADRKIVSISSKRQITIPQKFFQALHFELEAECELHDNEIIIRPVKTVYDSGFAEQILEELISDGLSGNELLAEFKKRQAQIRPAVKSMLSEAKAVAEGKSDYASYNDVFETEG